MVQERMNDFFHFRTMQIKGLFLLALFLGACSDRDIVTDARTPELGKEQRGGAETCESAPQKNSVFHWEVIEQFNGKETKALSKETTLAKHGSLNLRLLEVDYENGGREVLNPLHYGPVYIGDLEDFLEVDGIYDSVGLATAFPDPTKLLADIEAQIQRDDRGYLLAAFDEIWRNRSSGTTKSYRFAGADESLSLRETEDDIPFFDTGDPKPLFVIDRVRPIKGGGSDTRSFWFTKDDCLMVRYSTSFVIETSSQSAEWNLRRIDD